MSLVSPANLKALDRVSPKSSTSSLEKFLSTPITEEGASAAAIQAVLHQSSINHPGITPCHLTPLDASRSCSKVESESSISSVNSYQSCASRFSIDSRGSRRGRKLLRRHRTTSSTEYKFYPSGNSSQVSNHSSELFPTGENRQNGDSTLFWRSDMCKNGEGICGSDRVEPVGVEERHLIPTMPKHPEDLPADRTSKDDQHGLSCTWPDCEKVFRYRFDWNRHEEAVHYLPYRWICCLKGSSECWTPCLLCGKTDHATIKHCITCQEKDVNARTFYREDQLAQHIKRVHLRGEASTSKISKYLLSLWKCDNPCLPNAYLHCGFCGKAFEHWAQRQEHVFEHVYKGICKSSWWPERLAEPFVVTAK